MEDLSKEEIYQAACNDQDVLTYREAGLKAMQEYAAQEKKKEAIAFQNEIEDLRSRFEKSFNVAELRRTTIDRQIIELGDKDYEIERLKGLVKNQFYLRRNGTGVGITATQAAWQQFATENNL